MKKILIALILALSLLLSSCDNLTRYIPGMSGGDSDSSVDNGTSDEGVDINSPCPGGNEEGDEKDDSDKPNTDNGNDNDNDNGENDDTDGDNDNNGNTGDGNNGTNDGGNDNGDDNDGEGGEAQLTHKDDDDNGMCDRCGVTVIVEINFFVINDFHGKMSDSDTQPGADELSLYLKTLSQAYPNSILLSTGDMWQGGAESNLTKGILVTEWMNELDFVAMTLGNHEYDWGEEYIIENAEVAEFPLLAINIYDRDTNRRVDYCEPSVVIERGGIEIGIIGAIGDCYSSISSDKCEDVYFKTGSELTSLVKAESERLKASGVDYIVYTIHDGYDSSSSGSTITDNNLAGYYDVSLSSGGYVDLVFEGHTHQTYALKDNYGVYHVQGGGDNKGFSHVSADVNLANGNDKTKSASVTPNSVYKNLEDDPYILELFEKYADVLEKAAEVLGYNPSFISGNNLKQLVADLYCALGEKVWGDDYNIVLGGGYTSIRSPYNLYAGDVTYADLMMLFPFDNEIMLCSIKGSDLKKKFTQTTNSNYYICYGEYGNSIKNNINDSATYYVIVDSYTAQYKPNKLTIVDTYDPNVFARDLLAEYIKNGGLNR